MLNASFARQRNSDSLELSCDPPRPWCAGSEPICGSTEASRLPDPQGKKPCTAFHLSFPPQTYTWSSTPSSWSFPPWASAAAVRPSWPTLCIGMGRPWRYAFPGPGGAVRTAPERNGSPTLPWDLNWWWGVEREGSRALPNIPHPRTGCQDLG